MEEKDILDYSAFNHDTETVSLLRITGPVLSAIREMPDMINQNVALLILRGLPATRTILAGKGKYSIPKQFEGSSELLRNVKLPCELLSEVDHLSSGTGVHRLEILTIAIMEGLLKSSEPDDAEPDVESGEDWEDEDEGEDSCYEYESGDSYKATVFIIADSRELYDSARKIFVRYTEAKGIGKRVKSITDEESGTVWYYSYDELEDTDTPDNDRGSSWKSMYKEVGKTLGNNGAVIISFEDTRWEDLGKEPDYSCDTASTPKGGLLKYNYDGADFEQMMKFEQAFISAYGARGKEMKKIHDNAWKK